MPKVTKLTPQKNNSQRYNLFIDQEFYCGVDQETVVRFGIKPGQDFSEAELRSIFKASEISKLYQRALDYLAYRPRSIAEMRRYLRKKIREYGLSILQESEGAVQKQVEVLIRRLQKLNYLNDEEFTSWWIDQRTGKRKPYGIRRIRSELLQKGISGKLISKVWQAKQIEEKELITKHRSYIERKYNLGDARDRRRCIDYLKRRGFLWADIQAVLK